MKKNMLIIRPLVLFVALTWLASPVLAETKLKVNGWLGTKTAVSTRAPGGTFYVTNAETEYQYTHMRARIRFDFKATEYVGAVWYSEVDYNFGDAAFATGRGKGGGLGADVTNLETKNLYLYFKVPDKPLEVKVGIQSVGDNFSGVFIANDTAGYTFDVPMDTLKLKGGYYYLWDTSTSTTVDNVNAITLAATKTLSEFSNFGVAGYYLRDNGDSGMGALNAAGSDPVLAGKYGWGSTSNNPATGYTELIPKGTVYEMDSYILGAFGKTRIGSANLDMWGLYNFGDVKVTGGKNINISSIVLDARVQATLGPADVSVEGLYVSGSSKEDDEEFGFVNTGLYSSGSNFYHRHGMMILLPDGKDWNFSSALAYNVSNIYEDKFLGVTGLFGNAKFDLPGKFRGKTGLGTMMSSEQRAVNGNSYMGTEVNGVLTYEITKMAEVSFNAAYAATGDFYEVTAAQAAASGKAGLSSNPTPDNVYYTYLMFKVAF